MNVPVLKDYILVGGFNPSEKNSQLGLLFPTYGKNKKCSKPPTRYPLDIAFATRGFVISCLTWSVTRLNLMHSEQLCWFPSNSHRLFINIAGGNGNLETYWRHYSWWWLSPAKAIFYWLSSEHQLQMAMFNSKLLVYQRVNHTVNDPEGCWSNHAWQLDCASRKRCCSSSMSAESWATWEKLRHRMGYSWNIHGKSLISRGFSGKTIYKSAIFHGHVK